MCHIIESFYLLWLSGLFCSSTCSDCAMCVWRDSRLPSVGSTSSNAISLTSSKDILGGSPREQVTLMGMGKLDIRMWLLIKCQVVWSSTTNPSVDLSVAVPLIESERLRPVCALILLHPVGNSFSHHPISFPHNIIRLWMMWFTCHQDGHWLKLLDLTYYASTNCVLKQYNLMNVFIC